VTDANEMRELVADLLLDITQGAHIASNEGHGNCPHCDYPYKAAHVLTEETRPGGYYLVLCYECVRCGAVHTRQDAWGDW
jgi:DNA-directed RNA polymerase subunit M/transcription elongation factor TFIIS